MELRNSGAWRSEMLISIFLIPTTLPRMMATAFEHANAVQKLESLQVKLREVRQNKDWHCSVRTAKKTQHAVYHAGQIALLKKMTLID